MTRHMVTWAGGFTADPYEVPPAWRFNWAAARPPLFVSAMLQADALIRSVAASAAAACKGSMASTSYRNELPSSGGAKT
jgi:hypothetical protein